MLALIAIIFGNRGQQNRSTIVVMLKELIFGRAKFFEIKLEEGEGKGEQGVEMMESKRRLEAGVLTCFIVSPLWHVCVKIVMI